MLTKNQFVAAFILLFVVVSGCAEGMFWRTGYLSPWVRQQWSEEEQIASTLFSKRDQMQNMVDSALEAGPQSYEDASQALADIVSNDPILLLRIDATRMLTNFPTETAEKALQLASRDRQVEVRQASVRALASRGTDLARQSLVNMALNDADEDVRISAVAALGQYRGSDVSDTLSKAIQDPNPAMQIRAAESLAAVTGQDFGKDMQAWQQYLDGYSPTDSGNSIQVANEPNDDSPAGLFR